MKSHGIVRKLDDLGRIVLPSSIRKNLNIEKNDPLEIFIDGDYVVLRKYIPGDIFTGDMENLIEYKGKKISKKNVEELAKLAGLLV